MKVKDLIERLKTIPPELQVLVSGDEEGNHFNLLADISRDKFDMKTNEPSDDAGEWVIVLWP